MATFIQDAIIISILTIIGCFSSTVPYIVVCTAGVLLCIACARNLSDDDSVGENLIWWPIAFVFAFISGHFLGYLLLAQNRLVKNKSIRLLLPSIVYMLAATVQGKDKTPDIILCGLVLCVVSVICYMISQFIDKYLSAKNQISSAVSVTAINEMYAKKLNQELVMKNYLADKNARLEERENISRNIHNSVGHSITAAIMTLDAADMLFDTSPDKARDKMNVANERIRTSLSSIRQAVRVLDSENRYVVMSDFISELTAVVDNFVMDTMIKVYTDFEDVNDEMVIPHEYTEFLTGVVQELLSNGVRHGKADIFTVAVISDSSNLKVKVTDNGKSDFNHDNESERIRNGFGLKKMISYVKRCGGNIIFLNENGFRTEISLKLYKEDEHE